MHMDKYGFKRVIMVFLLGILAGLAIAFGGALFELCVASIPDGGRIVGSLAFSVGLLLVCACGLNLYTGKIGYLFDNDKLYILDLVIMLFGNLVGAVLLGYSLRFTSFYNLVNNVASSISSSKLIDLGNGGEKWYACLINSIFCGVLVYIGVNLYKTSEYQIVKILGLIASVFIFVALGFEHCVADMFYFALSNSCGMEFGRAVLSIFIYIVGNSLGSLAVNAIFHMARPKNKTNLA